MGVVISTKPAISPKWCKLGPIGYYDGLIAYALSIRTKINDFG